MRAVTRALLAFSGTTAVVMAAGVAGFHLYMPSGHALPGTVLEGRLLLEPQNTGEVVGNLRQRLLERSAYLSWPEDTQPLRFSDLGLEVDVTATLQRLNQDVEDGSVFERIQRLRTAERGELTRAAVWRFDRAKARATLEQIAERVHRPPINAALDLRGHRRVQDQAGRELDIEATLAAIEQGGRDELAVFPVKTRPIPAQVTTEMIASIDVSKVLASFETDFANNAGPRAVNIAKAAEYLNGTVLAPGAEFSFNKVVGPRVLERGFIDAPVIVNDELEKGVGGGVCQVASTLHAAAVFGALEVVRRRSHSRPSGYAPLGLDATVIDGEVDLKLRNPYDEAVIIHAFLPSKTRIRIELLGREPAAEVKHDYAVVERHEFARRITVKDWLGEGQRRRQKGSFGYDVVSVVRLKYPDGHTEQRRYKSKYYPVPEVYWVGPDTDLSDLPPLPEGATTTEFNGEVVESDMSHEFEATGTG